MEYFHPYVNDGAPDEERWTSPSFPMWPVKPVFLFSYGNILAPRQSQSFPTVWFSFVCVCVLLLSLLTPYIRLSSRWENQSCLRQQKGSEPEFMNQFIQNNQPQWSADFLQLLSTLQEWLVVIIYRSWNGKPDFSPESQNHAATAKNISSVLRVWLLHTIILH